MGSDSVTGRPSRARTASWCSALIAQGAPVNALSQDVLIELGDLIERIAIDPPKGVVIRSAKPAGFIAGADLKEFQEFDRKGTVNDAIRRGQAVFQKLAELPCPTVAAIHGHLHGRRHRDFAGLPLPGGIERPLHAHRPAGSASWASSRAGAAARACHDWSARPRRWT